MSSLQRVCVPRLAAAAASVLLAAACGGIGQTVSPSSAPGAAPAYSTNPNVSQCGKADRIITDANNFVTTIRGVPQRIVTVELSFADDVSLLSVSPVGIGDDNDPNLVIPQIRSRIGPYTSLGTRESPNFAVIAGLKPDLIIADQIGNRKIIDQLRTVAPTLTLQSQHTTYSQNIDTALTIGVALNQCVRMQKVLADHDATMATIKAKVPAGEHRSFVFALSSDKTFTVFNSQQYTGTVLEQLGLKAVATDPSLFPAGDASGVTLETLVQLDPDLIFYANVLDTPTGLFDTWQRTQLFEASKAAKTHGAHREGQKPWSLTRGITGSEVIAAQAVHDLYGK
ncbi:MAG TPA: ABC transporter substrate-binding protein [Candidatus Dormibacteraeota bacterium]